MTICKARNFLVRLVSVTLVGMGFMQSAAAGMVGTDYMIDRQVYADSLSRVEALLARDDVARQLAALGVDQAVIALRLQGLSHAELATLESRLDQQIAGGDALGVIGAVFLVLLILELVGVTDVFKSL